MVRPQLGSRSFGFGQTSGHTNDATSLSLGQGCSNNLERVHRHSYHTRITHDDAPKGTECQESYCIQSVQKEKEQPNKEPRRSNGSMKNSRATYIIYTLVEGRSSGLNPQARKQRF